ncbi:MAG: hypothetical protein A2234_08905 [Elusimicrobia bacterium RIFOXYA2_FULL_58_8]|nr:MAG: hypothetical protein A2285_01690 [Elusimicrobia bacterium RIFOXYA12_FULL_57_11]OGS15083.1 MAG: hypothetical protein A2234_08905 [Elusimicrobia bacterium RIFOXYA2_FULL_58_8]
MSDYGPQITWCGQPVWLLKTGTWLVNRLNLKMLALFGRFAARSPLAMFLARWHRRISGSYLYTLKLDVNTACFLKCKMCYSGAKQQDLQLPAQKIREIIDQIRGYKIRLEFLGGEPLLRSDLPQLVSYAKQHGRVPFVSVYTNAVLATGELARALAAAGLDAALVTLISAKKEVHDEFVGRKGAWEQATQGIKNLRDAGITVYTFTAIHRDNYLDYREIHSFVAGTLKAHALFYQYIPQQPADPLVIAPAQWHSIKRWVLTEQNAAHGEHVRSLYWLTGNSCVGGNYMLSIKADGTVHPCPFIRDIPIGNIHSNTIWEIYRDRYTHADLTGFKTLPADCAGCSHASVCGGGCRAGNRNAGCAAGYQAKDQKCLGPYNDPISNAGSVDCIPTFF